MLFSIVVPVFNVEKYLNECLDSIILQVLPMPGKCEILLIDDGSTDSSSQICDEYARNFPEFIKVYHKVNEGLLLTRRYGFKRARGEYILNCDSDDVLEIDALNILTGIIEHNNEPDVIIFNYYLYDGKNKKIAYQDLFTEGTEVYIEKFAVLKEFLLHHSVVSMWGKIYKRSCLDIEKDYTLYSKLSNGEDSLQSIEIYDRARNYFYINLPLYNYRIGSGMTGKFDPNYYQSFGYLFGEIEKRKEEWNMADFEKLFAIKVLSTAGRAITQSRYKKWGVSEHVNYLKEIRDDGMLQRSMLQIDRVKDYLQGDHYALLKLMRHNCFILIVVLLNIKNLQVNMLSG